MVRKIWRGSEPDAEYEYYDLARISLVWAGLGGVDGGYNSVDLKLCE